MHAPALLPAADAISDVPPPAIPLAVVMNVRSGHLDSDERLQVVRGALEAAGRMHSLWPVESADSLADAVARARNWALERSGALVAAGGDGTVNTLAQVAFRSQLPVGILPQGTFNYVARSHRIPVELEPSLRSLLQSRPVPVQVGRVNGHLFLVNASMGLYPQVLEDREAFKQQWGRYRFNAALSALLTVMREHRNWTLELDLGDREVVVRTATLFVGNNRMQLDRLGLPESQVIGHGLLGAVVVKPVSRWGLLGLALRGALGRLAEADAAQNFAFRRLTVRTRGRRSHRTTRVAVDGEVMRFDTPLHFDVATLPLLLPPSETPAAEAESRP